MPGSLGHLVFPCAGTCTPTLESDTTVTAVFASASARPSTPPTRAATPSGASAPAARASAPTSRSPER